MPDQDPKTIVPATPDARASWGTFEPHFPKAARNRSIPNKSDHKVFCSSVSPYFPSIVKR